MCRPGWNHHGRCPMAPVPNSCLRFLTLSSFRPLLTIFLAAPPTVEAMKKIVSLSLLLPLGTPPQEDARHFFLILFSSLFPLLFPVASGPKIIQSPLPSTPSRASKEKSLSVNFRTSRRRQANERATLCRAKPFFPRTLKPQLRASRVMLARRSSVFLRLSASMKLFSSDTSPPSGPHLPASVRTGADLLKETSPPLFLFAPPPYYRDLGKFLLQRVRNELLYL